MMKDSEIDRLKRALILFFGIASRACALVHLVANGEAVARLYELK